MNWILFGKQSLIEWLSKNVLKERPSLPRYAATFDVKLVFEYIKKSACSDDTVLDVCTKPLASTMCLLSG